MPNEKQFRLEPVVRQRARDLRREQTPAEQKLWQRLRRRQLNGYYFRRQHPIGRFIVDFYCAHAQLIVELDGDVHAFQEEYDSLRTEWLEAQGYRMIRFTNDQVFREMEAVLATILTLCEEYPLPQPLCLPGRGAGGEGGLAPTPESAQLTGACHPAAPPE